MPLLDGTRSNDTSGEFVELSYNIVIVTAGLFANLCGLVALVRHYRKLIFAPQLYGVLLGNLTFLGARATMILLQKLEFSICHVPSLLHFLVRVCGDLPSYCAIAVSIEQCATIRMNPYTKVTPHKRRHAIVLAAVAISLLFVHLWIIPGVHIVPQCMYHIENIKTYMLLARIKFGLFDCVAYLVMLLCHRSLIVKLNQPFTPNEKRAISIAALLTDPRLAISRQITSSGSCEGLSVKRQAKQRSVSVSGLAEAKQHDLEIDQLRAFKHRSLRRLAQPSETTERTSVSNRWFEFPSDRLSKSPTTTSDSHSSLASTTKERLRSTQEQDRNRVLSKQSLKTRRRSILQLFVVLVLILTFNIPHRLVEAIGHVTDGTLSSTSSLFARISYCLYLFQFFVGAFYLRLPMFRKRCGQCIVRARNKAQKGNDARSVKVALCHSGNGGERRKPVFAAAAERRSRKLPHEERKAPTTESAELTMEIESHKAGNTQPAERRRETGIGAEALPKVLITRASTENTSNSGDEEVSSSVPF